MRSLNESLCVQPNSLILNRENPLFRFVCVGEACWFVTVSPFSRPEFGVAWLVEDASAHRGDFTAYVNELVQLYFHFSDHCYFLHKGVIQVTLQ